MPPPPDDAMLFTPLMLAADFAMPCLRFEHAMPILLLLTRARATLLAASIYAILPRHAMICRVFLRATLRDMLREDIIC